MKGLKMLGSKCSLANKALEEVRRTGSRAVGKSPALELEVQRTQLVSTDLMFFVLSKVGVEVTFY